MRLIQNILPNRHSNATDPAAEVVAILQKSPLLDPVWYRQNYPDLRDTPLNVARHYLAHGAREGRNPGPHFHTTFYLKTNPDVAGSGMNPLVHFILYGMREGRQPFPPGAQTDPNKSAQIVQDEMNSLLTTAPGDCRADLSISVDELVTAPSANNAASQTSDGDRDRPFAILFLSGEPHTPGHIYRVQRYVDAARANGFAADCAPIGGLENILGDLSQYDALVIWRAAWSPLIEAAVLQMRELGKKIVFDVDDLMIDPDLARTSIIDGIRTQYLNEADVETFYGLIRRTMLAADVCFCTTQELAFHMRKTYKSTFVLPNGFDQPTHDVSRLAAKRRRQERDGLVRLGYAGGSRTHQRDFSVAIDAVARILREDPNCRLVLFRKIDGDGITHNNIDVDEYPSLTGLHEQIEWRQIQPLALLPNEIARFDVNLAPLEIGNAFCEAKSELKFFEAALVDVPTVASPTGPFRRTIDHGKDGFLAVTANEWYVYIQRLIRDDALRAQIVERAYYKSLALFGPRQRALQFGRVAEQIRGGSNAARGFALEAQLSFKRFQPPKVFPSVVIFERDAGDFAEVAVVVPLYNYEALLCEALDSVLEQTLEKIDLVVVDDCSTDSSLSVATDWAREHHARFNRVVVLQNRSNYGLGLCRNSGIAAADATYVLLLDADNKLLPKCCERLLETIKRTGAAFAYPTIRQFGDTTVSMSNFSYEAQRFAFGNYIDAMALVSKEAWAIVGGIEHVQYGWEDYDLWCRFAEIGLVGVGCQETLAEYRVHKQSMLRTHTTIAENYKKLHHTYSTLHPWVFLSERQLHKLVPSAQGVPSKAHHHSRLDVILPLVRCPISKEKLGYLEDGGSLVSFDGFHKWPIIEGRPCLAPDLIAPTIMPKDHLSNEMSTEALAIIRDATGFVLNLSAGGSLEKSDHVIEVEYAIFRHTDIVADAHELPFDDAVFEAVIVMNAFEHYRNPERVSAELHRVLKPGGVIYIRTAFLQPLHERPYHFYNCTKYGMAEWFNAFDVESLCVSSNFCPNFTVSWILSECERALRSDVSDRAADEFGDATIRSLVAMWRDPLLRNSTLWKAFERISQSNQEVTAAGFELLGCRPPVSHIAQ